MTRPTWSQCRFTTWSFSYGATTYKRRYGHLKIRSRRLRIRMYHYSNDRPTRSQHHLTYWPFTPEAVAFGHWYGHNGIWSRRSYIWMYRGPNDQPTHPPRSRCRSLTWPFSPGAAASRRWFGHYGIRSQRPHIWMYCDPNHPSNSISTLFLTILTWGRDLWMLVTSEYAFISSILVVVSYRTLTILNAMEALIRKVS